MSSGFTPTYQLPYPIQTDPVNVAGDMQDLAEGVESALNLKSAIASPQFTGIPTAPTAAPDTNTNQIATTEYVIDQGYLKLTTASATYAQLSSPVFSGTPTVPTAPSVGGNSLQIANLSFVGTGISNHGLVSSNIHGVTGSIVGTSDVQTLTSKTISGLSNTLVDIQLSSIPGLSSSYAPLNLSFNQQSGSYTLVASDASKQVEISNSSANTLTVPTNSSVPFPIGTVILVAQTGVGQTTIAPVSGTVVINGTPGLKLRTQWSVATLTKRGTNTWMVSGDLVA